MSNFIVIPKPAMRYALSDLLINTASIVTVATKEERDIPLIELCLGFKEALQIKFNNAETRDHFYKFIFEECQPKEAPSISEAVLSKSEKKRRDHARD